MRLYQHFARCPVALRRFLDCNPNYWCFIPLYWEDTEEENQRYRQDRSNRLTPLNNAPNLNTITQELVSNYYDRIPFPPVRYESSYHQQDQQKLFLHEFVSLPRNQLPYSPIDLYQYSIIAVLPDESTQVQQTIIKQLFAIHGETNLNMMSLSHEDPEIQYGRPYRNDWCRGLHQPSPTNKNR